MELHSWGDVVTDEAELRELVGDPAPAAVAKQRDHLHELDVAWLAASPFCLLATAGADGRCDVSPKGDPPGFVKVLDERTVVVPERPGNRRVDGFRNVLTNPHVGLISWLPGRSDTLRVNGRAVLVRDAPFFDDMVVRGHRPVLAVVVQVEEVFHHCSKAFLRSQLWDTATWDGGERAVGGEVPGRAHLARALERQDTPLEELQAHYGPRYAEGLYR